MIRMPALACALFAAASICRADILVVHPDGSGDYPTIQDAMDAASVLDTIQLADGVFTGPGNRDLVCRTIAMYSESGDPEACVIDAEGFPLGTFSGLLQFRVHGIGFHNGDGFYSIYVGGARFEDCRFMNCDRAVYAQNNIEGAVLALDNCTIERCYGDHLLNSERIELSNCSLIDNEGTILHCISLGVADSEFIGNREADNLIYQWDCDTCMGGDSFVDNCLFMNNEAEEIWYLGYGFDNELTISSCRFLNNSQGIFSSPGSWGLLDIDQCSFAGNGRDGGACFNYLEEQGGAIQVSRSIIAFRRAGEILNLEPGDDPPGFSDCNLYDNAGGDWIGPIADQYGLGCNMSSHPAFCNWGAGDLTLYDISPCLPENNECGVLIGAEEQGCSDPTIAPEKGAPAVVRLEQNHPNPFNPSTRITFNLAVAGRVSLIIHDALGRRVATLIKGEWCSAGNHSLDWFGRDHSGRLLPSGVYVAHLESESAMSEIKMTLLR